MKTFIIKSKHGNFEVFVDDEDYDDIMKRSWSISKNGNYTRVEARINGTVIRLHRYILKLEKGNPITVDHINRNPLDNRKINLRLCTQEQNIRNCNTKENKTGYRGVYRNHGDGKYRACYSFKNKTVHIPGNWDTPEDAAKARDEAILKVSGEFAILNFPKRKE